ncbi:type II secretion system protein N [Xanthomonas hortorum]|uniref:Type II secretion system protein C n=1 Tax=Xanthomonas hortorum pv. gardneri TaxID=2754056 RepID=A0A6V7BZT7_9XANT|nr:type II secretion system protein N [Xanthomonas hortorum]MCC4624105.1 PDZ domain-containing protein [Xanthomonas campestris pv. nigromaculans]APP81873.1 type II secretion system protein C [Xanthomonas hortorum pv. gardneri]EGD18376.1 Type II secretion system protein C [Xanthomonas hortorum ATCC 19865]KLA91235.1 type II secretion system protein C [Xanthomonas hortorum pv. gardneri]KLB03355.1 type II secretion system protein C [Xanthomonas hortorum pv. gardneri]
MSALQRALPSLKPVMTLRGVRTAVACVLLAVLALQCARLLWVLITPIGPLGTGQVATVADADVPALRRDVFYRSVPESNSDGIVLHGVRAGGTQAAAFLSNGDGKQGAYRVGDAVVPGVVVHAIASDHVLLRASNGVRRLALVESMASSSASLAANATTSASSAPAVMSNVGTAAGAAAATAVDPQQLLTTAGLRASTDGSGFTVMPRGDGALLRQAGLAPGDVLTQINGRTLDAEHLRELQDELRDGQAATLTYRRDGQTHTMTLKRPQ